VVVCVVAGLRCRAGAARARAPPENDGGRKLDALLKRQDAGRGKSGAPARISWWIPSALVRFPCGAQVHGILRAIASFTRAANRIEDLHARKSCSDNRKPTGPLIPIQGDRLVRGSAASSWANGFSGPGKLVPPLPQTPRRRHCRRAPFKVHGFVDRVPQGLSHCFAECVRRVRCVHRRCAAHCPQRECVRSRLHQCRASSAGKRAGGFRRRSDSSTR